MLKIALTIRKKEDQSIFYIPQSYYQFLSPFFQIDLILPRASHHYHDITLTHDCLLLCGGDDIDPYYYHQKKHSQTLLEQTTIETMDFALIHQFYHAHKPIIGICRGIQLLNVFFKGSLIQDIPSLYQTSLNHYKEHYVHIQQNTFLSQYCPHTIKVNSFHHQNILQVSPLFHINATSEDGLVEGIENHQVLAFQWHPERMENKDLFAKIIYDFVKSHSCD